MSDQAGTAVPSEPWDERCGATFNRWGGSGRQDCGNPTKMKLKVVDNLSHHPFMRLITGGVIIFLGIVLSDIPTMILSEGWPATDGQIVTCRLVGTSVREWSGNYYEQRHVYIRYQYFVNGLSYSSSAVNSISSPFSLYDHRYAIKFPVGQRVSVYYNPRNPAKAVLEPGFVDVIKAFDGISLLFLSAGIYFIFRGTSGIKELRSSSKSVIFPFSI